jgi:hypothetical protein
MPAALRLLLCALVLVGIAARLSPLTDPGGRLFWQYMTEDGYLLQTVARNMAIGLGMSTAEGTMPTNGVQPLVTFLFAAMYKLVGGSKPAGVALVTILSTVVATAAAFYLYRLAALLFERLAYGRELAAVGAALWFVAPQTIKHSMNGLETGLYYLAIVFTLQHYLLLVREDGRRLSWANRLSLGVLLGITFLARNDAVFFIAGLLLAHLVLGGARANGGYRARATDALVAGVASMVVALPWLINNYLLFGSIVPISGISQSHAAHFGQNLVRIPSQLFESAFLFTPIPGPLETRWPVVAISLLGVSLSVAGFWQLVARHGLAQRRFFAAGLFFLACLGTYYGLLFGAPHFLSRYLSSLSPFLWLATCASACLIAQAVLTAAPRVRTAAVVATAVLTLLAAAFAANDFRKGQTHMHRQVVEWVQKNVASSVWVGAVQTGTLGFFHDRTINLDGKVNPEALRVLVKEGNILGYVLRSKIQYIADWVGMAEWVKFEYAGEFARQFEVVVKDEPANLAVLRRVSAAGR